MTDKQVIIDCKYKFQNNEKFEGKPYCTLHNELCEDLSFACDDNCQIYDDYKQLARKTQECEIWKNQVLILDEEDVTVQVTQEQFEEYQQLKQEFEQLQEKYEALKLENEEGYEIVDELKHECEELKNKLACQININNHLADYQVTANKLMDRYSKALVEIEKHIESYKKQCNIPNNCVDNRLCSTCFLGGGNELGENILDIINKAKGEENV